MEKPTSRDPLLFQRFSTRLILTLVFLIFITTLAVGIPAYLVVQAELHQQALARLSDGARLSRSLLEAEADQIRNLTVLTAERPTLQRLFIEKDLEELAEYLETFLLSIHLDIIAIYDASGQPLIQIGHPFILPDAPIHEGTDYLRDMLGGQEIVLIHTEAITTSAATPNSVGFVQLGLFLDREFMLSLKDRSGYEHSLIVDSQRVAASLDGVLSKEKITVPSQALLEPFEITVEEMRFLAQVIPLPNAPSDPIAYLEVALNIDRVLSAERQALLAMISSTVLVAILGSILGSIAARRLTTPIEGLTLAAGRITRGDLNTPITAPNALYEIQGLAEAFEASRMETRRALQDLSHAKAWLETVIQSISEGIVTLEPSGLITSFSRGAERITGYSLDEALNQPIDQLLPRTSPDELDWKDLAPDKTKQHLEVISRGQRLITLEVTSARIESSRVEDDQRVLVLRDVTEDEATQNLRSYFLANITHEFRTPLSAINASVEVLRDDFDQLTSQELQDLMNWIHMSVIGLQTLIDNLLESLSIEAGRFMIHRKETNLNEIMSEGARVMQPLLARRQQELLLHLLPEDRIIWADPTRLTQVLVNLLSNASKYSQIGDPIDLDVEVKQANSLKISISDRGSGIPRSERINIFRRFIRLDRGVSPQYGIGLGLSVVKAIVREHGGTVGVDNREGGGSIFWFTLPLREEEE